MNLPAQQPPLAKQIQAEAGPQEGIRTGNGGGKLPQKRQILPLRSRRCHLLPQAAPGGCALLPGGQNAQRLLSRKLLPRLQGWRD